MLRSSFLTWAYSQRYMTVLLHQSHQHQSSPYKIDTRCRFKRFERFPLLINSLSPLFPSIPRDCDDSMKDSLAAALRHTREQAQRTYNRRTANEKKAAALELARQPNPRWRSDNSWVLWQRTARYKSRRSSWDESKPSYPTIKSACCGTGMSEAESTRSKWTVVSGQSPGNRWWQSRWPLPKADHTPSGYGLAYARYTKQSLTVDGILDLLTSVQIFGTRRQNTS